MWRLSARVGRRGRGYSRRIGAALWLSSQLAVGAAWPHAVFETRVAQANARIEVRPEDPELYLRRAEIYLDHGDHQLAREDLATVRDLRGESNAYRLAMGVLELRSGDAAAAEPFFDGILAEEPDHVTARLQRARARAEAGRPTRALADFDRALELIERPSPELILERSRAAASGGLLQEALRGLEEASASLGFMTSLEKEALGLEARLGRFEEAVARTQRAIELSPRPSLWLTLQAEVLEEAGRTAESEAAFRAALDLVRNQLVDRPTRSLRQLEQRALAGLDRAGIQGDNR